MTKDNFQLIWLICFLPFVYCVWKREKKTKFFDWKKLKILEESSGDCWLACEKTYHQICNARKIKENYSILIWRANKKLHPEKNWRIRKNHIKKYKKAIFCWITCACISVHTHAPTHQRTHTNKSRKGIEKNQTNSFLCFSTFIHWCCWFSLAWHLPFSEDLVSVLLLSFVKEHTANISSLRSIEKKSQQTSDDVSCCYAHTKLHSNSSSILLWIKRKKRILERALHCIEQSVSFSILF